MLTAGSLLALAMQCAPAVHPDTLHDIAKTESSLNPWAIAEIVPVKGGKNRVVSHIPSSKEDALKTVKEIEKRKHRYSVGVMQITNTNFRGFNVDAESMFNPCSNLGIAEKIIVDCYKRGGTLKRALSCYYSGNFDTGQRPESEFKNTSYIQRIGYVVPSTKAERQNTPPDTDDASADNSGNTLYPDSIIRGALPSEHTNPDSDITYPPQLVRGGIAMSVDKD